MILPCNFALSHPIIFSSVGQFLLGFDTSLRPRDFALFSTVLSVLLGPQFFEGDQYCWAA